MRDHNYLYLSETTVRSYWAMGAAFLCAVAGIDNTIQSSASYIQGWLKALKDDRKLLVIASAQAQKAANYILNRQHTEEE